MKIEAGRFYKTRDGQKVGPMHFEGSEHFDGDERGGSSRCYYGDGRRFDRTDAANDLIAEWQDGPVITETVKRIVPGVYGKVKVFRPGPDSDCVQIALVNPYHNPPNGEVMRAAELRAAAATLTEIADALDGAK